MIKPFFCSTVSRITRGLGLLALVTQLSGCALRYANVYVNAQLKSSRSSVSTGVYDGRTGLLLSDITPKTIYLTSKHPSRDSTLSLLTRTGRNGCPTYWQVVSVSHWSKSAIEAAQAANMNQVLFIIDDVDQTCSK